MNDNYVNVSEFARRAGVSRQTVYNKIKDGTLQYVEVEGRKLLSVKDVKKVVDTLDSSFDSSFDTFDSQVDSSFDSLTHSEKALDTSFDTLDDDDKAFFDGFDSHVDTSLDTSVNQLDTLQVDTSETFDSSKGNFDKAQMTFEEVFGEEFQTEKDSESPESPEANKAAADSDSVTVALLQETIAILKAQNETQQAQFDLLQRQYDLLEAQLTMKDDQIRDLSQRLQEAHTIANQQQQLYAAAEMRLKAITDQSTQEHNDTAEDGQKHWWQFWK